MDYPETFSKELFSAFDAKLAWYDGEELPRLLSEYRKLHAYVENLINTLLNKGSIPEDPYKHDKKISDIPQIDDGFYNENERNMVIGMRLSDLESALTFISNYLTFSVASLNLERIKKLTALNAAFQWNSVSTNSTKPNARGLAEILATVRQGSDSLAISVVNDSISNAGKSTAIINGILKNLVDFHKEMYKIEIRKILFSHPSFVNANPALNTQAYMAQIKKVYTSVMGKQPFYTELIEEILVENFGPNAEKAQRDILEKLRVEKSETVVKEKTIDTKEILMDSVRILTGLVPQLTQIISKLEDNKKLLESEDSSFFERLSSFIRKVFNVKPRKIHYRLTITNPITREQKTENIEIEQFLSNLHKRVRFYTSFSLKKTPGYRKIELLTNDKIVEFIVAQLAENQTILDVLLALEDFYKANISTTQQSKIKGIKMEIAALKNTLIKTNQRKAEYVTLIEEQEQMKKLGITNAF
jgi:hypothetical protein